MLDKITIYEPDNAIKKGYLAIFSEIFKEIIDNRWLTWQLFKRDFAALYQQSFLGVFWAFIIPFVSIGTFIILNRSGVLSVGQTTVPYPIYALLGLTFWQIFSTGLIASSNCLVKAGPMIVKINFSKKSLVIAACAQALVPLIVHIILLGALFTYYRVMPHMEALLFPIAVIPLLFLTLGLGLILSILNGIFRDTGNILSMAITFLMFLTPVLYTRPTTGILMTITKYNPLYYLVSAPRALISRGIIGEWEGFIIASIASGVIFFVCLVVFHLAETRVTERV